MPPTAKDHYKTLGVAETATADEIKKAYRKLAKKNHPDVTGGDKAKEARFKEISEAYETLGDAKRRGEYDEQRKSPFTGRSPFPGGGFPGGGFPGAGFPGGGRGGPFPGGRGGRVRVETGADLGDIFSGGATPGAGGSGGFSDLFENLFRGREAAQQAKGADVRARVEVDLPLAALGGQMPLSIEGKKLTVKLPAGVEDGQTIRIAGQGDAGPAGNGDLLIEVQVKPHAQFRRKPGEPKSPDLEVDVPVPVDVAILGGKVEVPTLESHVTMTLPALTSSGVKLRLKGKGGKKRGTDERGDLYAVVQVNVPKELPPKARELLEEFARTLRTK